MTPERDGRAGGGQVTAPVPPLAAILAKARRENFRVASLALPRRVRSDLLAVYAFARLVDDAGDESPGDREALLDALEAELDRAYAAAPTHPLMIRLADTVRTRGIPASLFRLLIEANRIDQRMRRYETFDDLLGYCARSANPVGRIVLHLLGVATPGRVVLSDRVCTALQLAEHWQDVREDLRERDRVYLPREDLSRFGCSEEGLRAASASPALRRLMAFEVERTRDLLDRGTPLVATLRGRTRVAVAGFVAGGRAALDAVERAGYDVLARPPRVSKARRMRAFLGVLREAR